VEAREPTPVACMFRPYRTRGQWGEPYGIVHKGGVQLLSYLIYQRVHMQPLTISHPTSCISLGTLNSKNSVDSLCTCRSAAAVGLNTKLGQLKRKNAADGQRLPLLVFGLGLLAVGQVAGLL
jgi:hypothetical protein